MVVGVAIKWMELDPLQNLIYGDSSVLSKTTGNLTKAGEKKIEAERWKRKSKTGGDVVNCKCPYHLH